MKRNINVFIASVFYLGYTPLAPGTVASAIGLIIYLLLNEHSVAYYFLLVLITVIGFITSEKAEKFLHKKDPSLIVIDEVAGAMITFIMLPLKPAVLITAFFLFRAFDMFKIYPANKFESLKGGLGIMGDDIVAGLYANIIMQLAVRLSGIV